MAIKEKVFDFMVEVAWKGMEGTQNAIIVLENKAYNMISLSGIFIAAIVAILVSVPNLSPTMHLFLILELFILISCVGFAFKTIWFKRQELLDIDGTVDKIDFTDIIKTKGNFVAYMEIWQEGAKDILKYKSSSLKFCMKLFLLALVFGFVFVIYYYYIVPVMSFFYQMIFLVLRKM